MSLRAALLHLSSCLQLYGLWAPRSPSALHPPACQGGFLPGRPSLLPASSGLLPAWLGFLLAQHIPVLAGAGEQSLLAPSNQDLAAKLSVGCCLVPQQALGFVTHGRALHSGIAPALRERAVSPVWIHSAPVGLGNTGAAGQEGCAFPPAPQLGPRLGSWGRTSPVPRPQDRSRAGGISIATRACLEPSHLTGIAGGLAGGAAGLPVHSTRGRLSLSGLCWDWCPGPAPHKWEPWQHPLLPRPRQSRLVSWCTFLYAVLVATRPSAPDA